MGTISEKLTYLNETKELIQEKIQDLGGIINNNSTFREYADILADVYNKYPKDSYSGTSIEIENSKKSKIEILINGNSNQNATPSPSNKVNISNSCGNNKINITKKNLLSLEDIPESTVKDVTYSCSNQTLHLNGTASGGMQIDFINVGVPAGTYHFSSGVTNPNGSGNYARYLMNSAGTSLKTNGGEVTLSEQTDVHFRFYANSGSVFDDATVWAQLEPGSIETTYEPWQGSSYPVNFPVENLLDTMKTQYENNGVRMTPNADGSITLTGTTTKGINVPIVNSNNPPVINAGTYIRVVKIVGTITKPDNTNVLLTGRNNASSNIMGDLALISNSTVSKVSTVNGTNTMSNINLYASHAGITFNCTIFPMLTYGNKINDYTPYGTVPMELCKTSSSYQDYVKKSTGKNLFNKNNVTDNGFYATAFSSNNDWCYINTTSFEVGKTYFTNQRAILSFWNGDTYISHTDKNNTTFTVPENTTNTYISTLKTNKDTLMINKGSIAIDYEPYGINKWYKYNKVGQIILDGIDENWTITSTDTANVHRFYTRIIKDLIEKPTVNSQTSPLLCSHFVKKSADQTYLKNTGICIDTNGFITIYSPDYSESTVEEWEAWLSSNNVLVLYPLATPTYTEITSQTLINQLNELEKARCNDELTIITQQNNNSAFELQVNTLKNS